MERCGLYRGIRGKEEELIGRLYLLVRMECGLGFGLLRRGVEWMVGVPPFSKRLGERKLSFVSILWGVGIWKGSRCALVMGVPIMGGKYESLVSEADMGRRMRN